MTEPRSEIPNRLSLVLRHLGAVGELNEYLSGKDVKSELDKLHQILRGHLERELPALKASWSHEKHGAIPYWIPSRWQVTDADSIALCVILPSPVEKADPDPSVNLYVPTAWRSRGAFVERLRSLLPELHGFEHIDENEDWFEDYPLGRWLEYSGFIHPENGFELDRFLE
jgi:hypothetical protein